MKLLLKILLVLFLLPLLFTLILGALIGEPSEFTPVNLEAAAAAEGDVDRHIRVEGFLLRLKSPNAVRDGQRYVFPFVDRATAEDAVAKGAFAFSEAATPLVATVRAKDLPVEAFARPPAGKTEPVAIPYVLEGSRRVKTVEAGSRIPLLAGVPSGSQIVLLDGSPRGLTAGGRVALGVIGLVSLIVGLRWLRASRQRRRKEREMRELFRTASPSRSTSQRASSKGSGSQSPPSRGADAGRAPAGRSFGIPWGKIAGVIILIGIAGARLGKSAAPAADNVARGVARTFDDAASAARSAGKAAADLPPAELPSAGDVALEAASQIPNVKTGIDVANHVRSTSGEESPAQEEPQGRVNLTVTVDTSRETYEPRDAGRWVSGRRVPGSGDPAVLQFDLVKLLSWDSIAGELPGRPRVSAREKSTELPDESRGEFTRLTLRSTGTGVRLTQSFAVAMKGGYVKVLEASGDMAFVGGGSWASFAAGDPSAVLEFTEQGTAEYSGAIAAMIARTAESTMAEEGFAGWRLEGSYRTPPVQELLWEERKLILRQRGKSVLELRGKRR